MSDRFVVVSRASADDAEYVSAVVHPDEDSATEALGEVSALRPWQSHSILTEDAFANPESETVVPDDDPALNF